MDASYYMDLMKNYKTISSQNKRYYFGLAYGMAKIHHTGDESQFYVLYRYGAMKCDEYNRCENIKLSDLTGTDFEIYNNIQIMRSGYIVLDEESPDIVMDKLLRRIKLTTDNPQRTFSTSTQILCNRKVKDSFRFYTSNLDQVHIESVKRLRRRNIDREFYTLRPIPFIPDMRDDQGIHVEVVQNVLEFTHDVLDERSERAITELHQLLCELGVKFKYVSCNIEYPCYV